MEFTKSESRFWGWSTAGGHLSTLQEEESFQTNAIALVEQP